MPDKKKKIHGNDPALNQVKVGKGERLIEVDSEMWSWKLGSKNVSIRDPARHSHTVAIFDKDGHLNTSIAHYQKDTDPQDPKFEVTPGHVESYIRINLLRFYKQK